MVGSGYVGLVSGACFADFGHDVVCIDKDQGKIDRLHAGIMPIYEPGLDALVETNVKAGRLSFTTSLGEGIAGADAIFIAVGTPSRRGDGHADLTFVYEVAQEVGEKLANDAVVVTKSTVPVGTGDEVERIIAETGTAHKVSVVSSPEFLREGAAIGEFKRPDRAGSKFRHTEPGCGGSSFPKDTLALLTAAEHYGIPNLVNESLMIP